MSANKLIIFLITASLFFVLVPEGFAKPKYKQGSYERKLKIARAERHENAKNRRNAVFKAFNKQEREKRVHYSKLISKEKRLKKQRHKKSKR